MAVDISLNPIQQVFQGIWVCLESNAAFAALVPEMNRIDYTSDTRHPEKPGMLTSDMPQVRVIQTAIGPQIFRTSNSSSLEVDFAIEVKVGDQRLISLTDVQFAVYAAMAKWQTYMRDVIEWEGEYPCKRVQSKKVQTELTQQKKPPEPMGWITVWQGTTDLFMSTSEVQAYNVTGT